MTRPSKNAVTGDYTNAHKGYDFSGRDDDGIYACLDGTIEQSVNLYVNAWQSVPPLTTRDYGNYIKTKHTDGTYSLYAHLKKDSLLPVGSKVKEGQRIATVGNTGNSTGAHLHFEYRNSSNTNIKPTFEKESMSDTITLEKKVFEELVTKSSRADEFAKLGYTSAAQIEQEVAQLKKAATDAQAEKKAESDRADAARKEFVGLLASCAKALNTTQEITQVEAALHTIGKRLDELDDLQNQYASLQLESGKQAEQLRAEIARLEALVKVSGSLAGATFEQLLAEFVRRIKNILSGRTV